ncbi:hypothetical protein [Fodinicola acaciae]|uniref:hypothetical protein n=1 Tax=Fodinicola acaciae TaxID=2681555 RepID=UPI0013D0A0F2|nr:hypothetical protein [Fodinicola acaciae]
MIDLDLRHLDDVEPPVATEQRLGLSMVRGRALRRKHHLFATTAATTAVVLVIALAGVVGLMRPHLGTAIDPAGGTPTSQAGPPDASPTPQPYEINADGIDPYLIGADAEPLAKAGKLSTPAAVSKCPATYVPLGTYKGAPLRIGVSDGQIAIVVASGEVFHTPNHAIVGMTEDELKRTIDAAQLVAVPTPRDQAYTIGRSNVMAFVFLNGRITLLVAGPRGLVTQLLQTGALTACR